LDRHPPHRDIYGRDKRLHTEPPLPHIYGEKETQGHACPPPSDSESRLEGACLVMASIAISSGAEPDETIATIASQDSCSLPPLALVVPTPTCSPPPNSQSLAPARPSAYSARRFAPLRDAGRRPPPPPVGQGVVSPSFSPLPRPRR
jgi:hypothetical protein